MTVAYFSITLVIVAYFILLGVAFKLGRYSEQKRYRKERRDESNIRNTKR